MEIECVYFWYSTMMAADGVSSRSLRVQSRRSMPRRVRGGIRRVINWDSDIPSCDRMNVYRSLNVDDTNGQWNITDPSGRVIFTMGERRVRKRVIEKLE